ncbi:VIT1/CCC1 transporter family protein [Candidatus Daviesbacteria bacterium]|nr:VIT1/CCC1 transporter family protein [Candidatus Daviesbacteria bacterium]
MKIKRRSVVEEEHQFLWLSDTILGGQDGLVNVLGLVLGVAAATADSRIILAAGFAAAFAESIAMAGVAYTSRLTEHEHYLAEKAREAQEINQMPQQETEEIRAIFTRKGFVEPLLSQVVGHITSDKKLWLDTMMRDELGLEEKTREGAIQAALVVGISAILGSLIPLVPFFFLASWQAMWLALAISALVLFLVGLYKARVTIGKPWKSGLQMMTIGITSALAGYLIGLVFRLPAGV